MKNRDLEKALSIALKAHCGQKDKNGFPYVFHPIRVMLSLNDPVAQIVALLHDVAEDSDISVEYLQKAGFDAQIVEAVGCLTKGENEDYFDYIKRVKQNPLARTVKLADLQDNLNLNRLNVIDENDFKRFKKYLKAKEILKSD